MNESPRESVWVLVGTRPEAIKQIPVYWALLRKLGKERVRLVSTGQHKELLAQALDHFRVSPDEDLGLMVPGQALTSVCAAVLKGLESRFARERPACVLVQGDTMTSAMAAWAAFLHRIPVAHSEAGLRSHSLDHPFPEEADRRLISVVSRLHFAPTSAAVDELKKEGVSEKDILLTGNPGIDALQWTLAQPMPPSAQKILDDFERRSLKFFLLTAHRRENEGAGMENWFAALARFLETHPDVALLMPKHPNQIAHAAATRYLGRNARAVVVPAMSYLETCHLLRGASFVVTDSGGIQEEAATLGVPAVVCRETTERMEAVHAGASRLAGTRTESILEAMEWALARGRFEGVPLFGDGQSAERIATALVQRFFHANVQGG